MSLTIPDDSPAEPFLDVPSMLHGSAVARRAPVNRLVLLLAGVLIAFMIIGSKGSSHLRQPLQWLTLLGVVGVLGAGAWASTAAVHRRRREQQALDDVEELIQLRQWEPAAQRVEALLGVPSTSPRFRAQALLELAAILMRYERFEDAIAVHTHLLENEPLDDASSYVIRMSRAMAMLREDHLLDADRAIADLKRRSAGNVSGLQALIELYRDVKTGHAAEALELIDERLPLIRKQMGHRVADAHALHARALDMLDRKEEAAAAFERATLLAPAGELLRRYPDLRPMFDRYTPAPAPAEAA